MRFVAVTALLALFAGSVLVLGSASPACADDDVRRSCPGNFDLLQLADGRYVCQCSGFTPGAFQLLPAHCPAAWVPPRVQHNPGGLCFEDPYSDDAKQQSRDMASKIMNCLVVRGDASIISGSGVFGGVAAAVGRILGQNTSGLTDCTERSLAELRGELKHHQAIGSEVGAITAFLAKQLVGLIITMADPNKCYACSVLVALINAMYDLGAAVYSLLIGPLFVIYAFGFGLWFVFRCLRIIYATSGDGQTWGELGRRSAIFALVAALLGAGAATDASLFFAFMNGVIGPVVSYGLSLGLEIVYHFSSVVGHTTSGEVSLAQILDRGLDNSATLVNSAMFGGGRAIAGADSTVLNDLRSGIAQLGYALHYISMAAMFRAMLFVEAASRSSGGLIAVPTLVAGYAMGGYMLFLLISFYIVSGIRLLDPIVRLVLLAALLPGLLVAAVFPSTRAATIVGLRSLAYAAVYFTLIGLVFALALQLIAGSTGLGCLLNLLSESADQTLSASRICSDDCVSNDLIEGANGEQRLDFLNGFVIILMIMIATGIVGQVSQIAGQLTGGQGMGQIAEHVEGQTRGFAQQSLSVGMSGAMIAGAGIIRMGSGLARGVGSLFGR